MSQVKCVLLKQNLLISAIFRQERAKQVPVTRNSTGKLPSTQPKPAESPSTVSNTSLKAAIKTVPDEKIEQQLKTQRVVQQQKRVSEVKQGK